MDVKATLHRLKKNLNMLRERAAKYGRAVPLELLNQIEDHEQALTLTQQAVQGELSQAEWQEALKPLLVSLNVFGPFLAPPPPLQRPPRAKYFTGRQNELTQLLTDLQPGRVVTLCGPGGIGKSALAAEAVWTLAPDRFPDGIIFHNFSSQPQANVALEHIARTLGEEPKPTPAAAAQRALAGRQSLLILDSAEDADDLSAVLAIRGECGLLVTSRRRQDAQAERQDIEPLASDEAVKLLRAWGRNQTNDEAATVRIVDLVGRVPLAVRLVGRYLEQTGETAAEYLEWLEETPIEALSQGAHREENVARLLEHSLAQVDETAQQVLMVAGVLALASFDRAVITAALEISSGELRRALNQLVSYGLLRREGDRFVVSHALIHLYAQRRLTVASQVVQRVARYYTDLAEGQSKLGPEGYARLDSERVHIMPVLTKCAARKYWDEIVGLVQAVQNYLRLQGFTTDQIMTLEMGLTAAQSTNHRDNESTFLIGLGDSYLHLSQIDKAIDYYEQVLKMVRKNGNRRNEGVALGSLGIAYRELGQVDKAIEYHQQALTIARKIGNRGGESTHLGNLGMAYHDLGQVDKAIECWEQALTIDRQLGDRRLEGRTLNSLGMAYNILGQAKKAIEYLEEALLINREIGHRRGEGDCLDFLGNVYQRQEQIEKAIEYHEQALAISREIGHQRGEGIRLGNLGRAYLKLGQVDQAIKHHEQALVIARKIGDKLNEAISLHNLASDYQAHRQVDKAIEHLKQSLAVVREGGYRGREVWILSELGKIYQDVGHIEKAIKYHEQALVTAQAIGDQPSKVIRLNSLGNAYSALQQMDKAVGCYEQALTIAQEIGNQRFASFLLLVRLGNAKLRMELFDEALTDLDRGLELNPDDDWGYSNWGYYERGLIYLIKNNNDQAQNDFSRAIDLARQTYQNDPQNWRNTLNLALYLLAKGETETAKQIYQEAIEGQPPPASIREAVDDVVDFLKLFPDHAQAQAMHELLQQHVV